MSYILTFKIKTNIRRFHFIHLREEVAVCVTCLSSPICHSIYQSVNLFTRLSVLVTVTLPICLSPKQFACLCTYFDTGLSIFPLPISIFISLNTSLDISLPITVEVSLHIYLPLYLLIQLMIGVHDYLLNSLNAWQSVCHPVFNPTKSNKISQTFFLMLGERT